MLTSGSKFFYIILLLILTSHSDYVNATAGMEWQLAFYIGLIILSCVQSCKRYFFEVFKYKILLRNVFEILLSNTSSLRSKIQNTCSRLYLKYKIHKIFQSLFHTKDSWH